MRQKISEMFNIILIILLIIFGIFIAYQIIKLIFVGSWTTESIMVSLVILIITSLFIISGFLINQARSLGKIESSLENLKNSFCNLAKDFKEHLSKYRT